MHRIVKSCYLDMAHRIKDHGGRCSSLHGHTWKIELSLSCEDTALNSLGMVIDFGELKERFFSALDLRFDHSCILSKDDDYLDCTNMKKLNIQKLPLSHLTAETISKFFYEMAKVEFNAEGVSVDYVRVYEQLHPTESYAEYSK